MFDKAKLRDEMKAEAEDQARGRGIMGLDEKNRVYQGFTPTDASLAAQAVVDYMLQAETLAALKSTAMSGDVLDAIYTRAVKALGMGDGDVMALTDICNIIESYKAMTPAKTGEVG